MSKVLDTEKPDVKIISFAHSGVYDIEAYRQRTESVLATGRYPVGEYLGIIKKLWNEYLDDGKRPNLLGQFLKDRSFVTETCHAIAPSSFFAPDSYVLPKDHEEIIYWLMSQKEKIDRRMGRDEGDNLVEGLEYILRKHLERKGMKEQSKV